MTKIPQHGDPELIPKPVVDAPTNRYLPFGPSGVKLPDGPQYAAAREPATDLRNLPWTRYPNEKWTSREQRAVVLEMIRSFLHANMMIRRWGVFETDQPARMSVTRGDPILRFAFIHKDGRKIETSISFRSQDLPGTIEAFSSQIAQVRKTLNVLAGGW